MPPPLGGVGGLGGGLGRGGRSREAAGVYLTVEKDPRDGADKHKDAAETPRLLLSDEGV